jgi:hypothetical protein
VWIETVIEDAKQIAAIVTPRVGVWIETRPRTSPSHRPTSPLLPMSPVYTGVWIETFAQRPGFGVAPGHPPRGGVD